MSLAPFVSGGACYMTCLHCLQNTLASRVSAGRQGLTWFSEDQSEERAMLARWTVAFSFATMAHLRKESDLERSLQARQGC